MTKMAFWFFLITLFIILADWHDGFSKKCVEAGGYPTLTLTHYICLHPTSVIILKE